jgi:hypothetical protein
LGGVVPVTKTVRVRILVAIDTTGDWQSYGHSKCPDDWAKEDISTDALDGSEVYHWVEADIPVPVRLSEDIVEGTVSDAG